MKPAPTSSLNTLLRWSPPAPASSMAAAARIPLTFVRYAERSVDEFGIGDAAASLVGPKFYDEFVWPFEKKLVDGLHALGTPVRLHICGNTSRILAGMGRLGCEIIDLDYLVSLADARRAMAPDQILLGNLNPVACLRDSSPAAITAALTECRRQAGPRYIVGAGCEVVRDTPLERAGHGRFCPRLSRLALVIRVPKGRTDSTGTKFVRPQT
jgi:uroporphyrinogen-III decarboxylase